MNVGDRLMVSSVCARHECFICGEDATKRHTYLLPRARNNPKSAGYGKDDISRCEDTVRFTCDFHPMFEVDGHEWCGTYTFSKQYEHMFLYWKETGRQTYTLKSEVEMGDSVCRVRVPEDWGIDSQTGRPVNLK